MISRLGWGGPSCWNARTTNTATWSRRDTRELKNTPCSTGPPLKREVAFLGELTGKRKEQRLPGLHPAAREMPAWDVAVPDEKHAAEAIHDHGAHPQGQAARIPPIRMQATANGALERATHILDRHHGCLSMESRRPREGGPIIQSIWFPPAGNDTTAALSLSPLSTLAKTLAPSLSTASGLSA